MKKFIDLNEIPEHYVAQYFNQYVGYPKYRKGNQTYNGGCPFCHEGGSWGKKSRFFYIPKNNITFCHNCGYSKRPYNFVLDVSGLTYDEMLEELEEYDILPKDVAHESQALKTTLNESTEALPIGYINLTDSNQLNYYKDDKIVQNIIRYIKDRKLDVAINRPKTYYTTLKDFTHKNRLILPFYNSDGELIYYQSRKVIDNSKTPNYLSKSNGDKILPNLNNIDITIPHIFVFEGPIDSYFCKNGTAVSGIQENSDNLFSELQNNQLKKFYLFDIIWVLDSQWKDNASISKTKKLLDMDQKVFIWPKKQGLYFKDFNEMAVKLGINEISYKWVLKNTHDKITSNILLSQIEKCRN
jgi:hypothetical protein